MAFPVTAASLFNASEAAIIQLKSLKMILQDSDYSYPADKPSSN